MAQYHPSPPWLQQPYHALPPPWLQQPPPLQPPPQLQPHLPPPNPADYSGEWRGILTVHNQTHKFPMKYDYTDVILEFKLSPNEEFSFIGCGILNGYDVLLYGDVSLREIHNNNKYGLKLLEKDVSNSYYAGNYSGTFDPIHKEIYGKYETNGTTYTLELKLHNTDTSRFEKIEELQEMFHSTKKIQNNGLQEQLNKKKKLEEEAKIDTLSFLETKFKNKYNNNTAKETFNIDTFKSYEFTHLANKDGVDKMLGSLLLRADNTLRMSIIREFLNRTSLQKKIYAMYDLYVRDSIKNHKMLSTQLSIDPTYSIYIRVNHNRLTIKINNVEDRILAIIEFNIILNHDLIETKGTLKTNEESIIELFQIMFPKVASTNGGSRKTRRKRAPKKSRRIRRR